MRRSRSDELPRYVNGSPPSAFQGFLWRRRHFLYTLGGLLFVWWLFFSKSTPKSNNIDWSHYAYSLYATDSATLCHALMVFNSLAALGSKADRVLFYPKDWDMDIANSRDRDSQLLVMARDEYDVKLQPITLLSVEGRDSYTWTGTWDKSVTKFMAFSLGYYDRVIALDSDITLLKNIDELFLLPDTPIALPRAYWYRTKPWPLTSLLMVIKPNKAEFQRFLEIMPWGGYDSLVQAHKFDMELINDRFEDNALVLPHRPYALLSGEFRRNNHTAYLGNPMETWDAEKALKEAKLVHFSDWPLPKPWVMWPLQGLAEIQPDCGGSREGTCAERKIWKGLYEDFRGRRKSVCRLLSVPAPDWNKISEGWKKGNVTEGTEPKEAAPEVKAPQIDEAATTG